MSPKSHRRPGAGKGSGRPDTPTRPKVTVPADDTDETVDADGITDAPETGSVNDDYLAWAVEGFTVDDPFTADLVLTEQVDGEQTSLALPLTPQAVTKLRNALSAVVDAQAAFYGGAPAPVERSARTNSPASTRPATARPARDPQGEAAQPRGSSSGWGAVHATREPVATGPFPARAWWQRPTPAERRSWPWWRRYKPLTFLLLVILVTTIVGTLTISGVL